jgi:hypothetical protein
MCNAYRILHMALESHVSVDVTMISSYKFYPEYTSKVSDVCNAYILLKTLYFYGNVFSIYL